MVCGIQLSSSLWAIVSKLDLIKLAICQNDNAGV